jgi:predicted small secreted protein
MIAMMRRPVIALLVAAFAALAACGNHASKLDGIGSGGSSSAHGFSGIGGNSITPGAPARLTLDSDAGNLLSGNLGALLAKAYVSSPLNGGGTIASPFSLIKCAANQIWKMDSGGTTWSCAPDSTGVQTFAVTDYGAKCDGSTDDRAAIQSALAAAATAGGGVVVFPPGVCTVTRSGSNTWALTMPGSNVTLLGIYGKTYIKAVNNIAGVINVPVSLLVIDNQSNILIENMGFDGNWGNAVTAITNASNAQLFPSSAGPSTINVVSTSGFPTSGTMYVIDSTGTAQAITYTGKTSTSFTGCSGGSGTMFANAKVGYVDANTGINQNDQVDPKSHGIMIRGAKNVTVQDTLMQGVYGDCIWSGFSASDSTIFTEGVRIINTSCNIAARDGFSCSQQVQDVVVQNSSATNIFGQAFDTEPVTQPVRNVVIQDRGSARGSTRAVLDAPRTRRCLSRAATTARPRIRRSHATTACVTT